MIDPGHVGYYPRSPEWDDWNKQVQPPKTRDGFWYALIWAIGLGLSYFISPF